MEPLFDEMELAPRSEQQRWEEEHVKLGSLKFGAKDAKQKHKVIKTLVSIILGS